MTLQSNDLGSRLAACSGPMLVVSAALSVLGAFTASRLSAEELTLSVDSEYQPAPQTVRILLPNDITEGRHYPVLYLLPVEAGAGRHWGDAFAVVRELDLANRFQVICAFPEFAQLPWYADHPTEPAVRQESFFIHDVLPAVEAATPAMRKKQGRLLLGFSKSGFGAWSLLLRHPDLFSRAAAFDAPLMLEKPGRYGSGPIFGSRENFRGYYIPFLLDARKSELQKQPRLILIGKGNFQSEHQQIQEFLREREVPVIIDDSEQRAHRWNVGWVEIAARELLTNR